MKWYLQKRVYGIRIPSPSHPTPSGEDYSSTTSWSPFPDKGRLNVTRFVVLYIFIYLYTIINKSFEVETIPTSLPLSGKGDLLRWMSSPLS